ncbi:hypothetical protein DPMN_073033 [Dreissena polymorpha]|uniref:Uncharacterized protein n=1 Tax=Dreissena polymorpha TaxID=45954 RepID=A0A9D4HAA2_DREPO|nr:hypothetical protein DPMN_073033 [Dreissena polymorpha]
MPAPWQPCFSTNQHHFRTRPRYYWDESSDQVFEDWTINVASRVLTRFYYSHIRKNALPHGSHVFLAKVTIFVLIQDIIGTNLLSKFREDRKINVASREKCPPPPPGGHVFQPTGIIFELIQDIMNLLTKKSAPPLGSHVFRANVTIFKLIQDIIETNLLTKFHLTKQMLRPHNGQKVITKAHHEHVALR